MFKFFMALLMVQMFYSFSATVMTHNMSAFDVNSDITSNYVSNALSLENISSQVGAATQSQINIPLIELGALVFYSGNILVDLMLNFFFAIPSMFSILTNGLFTLFAVDPFLKVQLQVFVFVFIGVLYIINLISFLLAIRSGRAEVV